MRSFAQKSTWTTAFALVSGVVIACGGADAGARKIGTVSVSGSSVATTSVGAALPRGTPKLVASNGRTCELRSDGSVGCWGEALSDWSVGPTWVAGVVASDVAITGGTMMLRDRSGVTWTLPKDTRPERIESFTREEKPSNFDRVCERESCCWIEAGSVRCSRPSSDEGAEVEEVVTIPDVRRALQVSVGTSHACALTADGELFCWGSHRVGQLGVGSKDSKDLPATLVPGLGKVAEIGVSGSTTCARTTDGLVYCWGANTFGVVGAGTDHSPEPRKIEGLLSVVDLSVAGEHACAVEADGGVYCWGAGEYGQLGNGSNKRTSTPKRALGIDTAIAVAADGLHTCALLRDESVSCWGERRRGQLGDGRSSEEHVAVPVAGVRGATRLCAQTELYPRRTCVVSTDHDLFCWSKGASVARVASGVRACDARCVVFEDGHLECGRDSTPKVKDVIDSSAWMTSGCARTTGGAISCWQSEPTAAKTVMTGATAVQSGSGVGCALKGHGELWCWGDVARYGSTTTPIRAEGLDDVEELSLDDAIGIGSGVLRRSSGEVDWFYWALARLDKSKLELMQRPLEGVTNAVALAGGAEDGCVVLADGHVRCWGSNGFGELGNDQSTSKTIRTPTEVQHIDDATAVAIGSNMRCALRRSGEVSCWGLNDEGQLGKPFEKTQSSPLPITRTR